MLKQEAVVLQYSVVFVALLTVVSGSCPAYVVTGNELVESENSTDVFLTCASGYNVTGGDDHLQCISGVWAGDSLVCTPIVCPTPAINDTNIISNYGGDNGYGTVFYVACLSGYALEESDSAYVTYTDVVCNQNGNWQPKANVSNFDFSCTRVSNYIGCIDEDIPDLVRTDAVPNPPECRSACNELQHHYIVLYNSSCYCGQYKELLQTNNERCNANCTEDLSGGFCEGQAGEMSVYLTYDGCYSNLSLDAAVAVVNVYENQFTTCQQYCYGAGARFAVIDRGQSVCTCLNAVNPHAVFDSINSCRSWPYVSGSMFVRYTDLNRKQYASCDNIYVNGMIRVHGNYSLSLGSTPTYCTFKDGTICDQGWVGYAGSCYTFGEQSMTFRDSVNSCKDNNATLLSVLDKPESEFIQEYIETFSKPVIGDSWYLGLYSQDGDGIYTWSDGNMMQFTQFYVTEPQILNSNMKCVVLKLIRVNTKKEYQWFSQDCETASTPICKKNESYRCIDQSLSLGSAVGKDDKMSITNCIQLCKGQEKEYAIISNETCWCQDGVVASDTSFGDCNIDCPGSSDQSCGGDKSFVVIHISGYRAAESCIDLEILGIGDNNFYTEGSTSPEYCPSSGCNKSWIGRTSHSSCYKVVTSATPISSCASFCLEQDAYLVSLDDYSEKEFLVNVTQSMEQYKDKTTWGIGLTATTNTRSFRWANSQNSSDVLTTEFPSLTKANGQFYVFTQSGALANLGGNVPFICEKGEEYLGCFEITRPDSTMINNTILTKRDMITCIEWCRSEARAYAMLGDSHPCTCGDVLPAKTNGSNCKSLCLGIQPCGGPNGHVSVYQIDKFPQYASCEELFGAGVSFSGKYRLLGGYKECSFYDGETPCDDGWVGYNGRCFRILGPGTGHDTKEFRETCRLMDGHLATIYDADHHSAMYDYFANSFLLNPYDRVHLGILDVFNTNMKSWASGEIVTYYPSTGVDKYVYLISDYSARTKFRTAYAKTNRNFMCQKVPAHIGCFNKTQNYNHTLTHWMELTFCKQYCLGNGYQYAGIQEYECSCFNHDVLKNEMSEVSDDECSTLCPGHEFQNCGTGNSVNLYSLGNTTLADSCSTLYGFGILYNGTYLLNTSTGEEYVNCGFMDDTSCPPGWYGLEGTCYKIFPQEDTLAAATTTCLGLHSFVISPTQTAFLYNIVKVPVYSGLTQWWSALIDQFGNHRYLHGGGLRFKVQESSIDSSSSGLWSVIWYFTSTSFLLLKTTSNTQKLPYSCQKFNGYLGCIDVSSISASAMTTISHQGMTATLCIQYCLGKNSIHAGIRDSTKCQCFDTEISASSLVTTCQSCPGYSTQACGSSTAMSVYILSHYSDDVYESCDELHSYGVSLPSTYYIKPEGNSEKILVTCFKDDPSLMSVDAEVDVEYTASSNMVDYLPKNSRIIWPYSKGEYWKPAYNKSDEELILTFDSDMVVTGIITQGSLTDEWVVAFQLSYWDSVMGSKETYSSQGLPAVFNGNQDDKGFSYIYLTNPIITRKLYISPLAWYNWPSLRVTILGQTVSNYNFTHSFLNCFYTPSTDVNYVTIENNMEMQECKEKSETNMNPFYSLVNGTCFMWWTLPWMNGTLDDRYCNDTDRMLVYRSYDKFCKEDPVDIPFSNQSASRSDVYIYGTTVTYTCDDGYIFPDKNTSKTIVCQQDNKWSTLNDTCQAVYCDLPDFPANSSVDSKNNWYDAIIKVTCNDGFLTTENEKDQYIECMIDTTWNDTLDKCEVEQCPDPPSILHGTFTLLNDTTAVYTCNEFYEFSDGSSNKTVTCHSYASWEILNDSCVRKDDGLCYRSTHSIMMKNTIRTSLSDMFYDDDSRSVTSCSGTCLSDVRCLAYNYVEGKCRLFKTKTRSNSELGSQTDSIYFEREEQHDDLRSCD